MKLQNRVAMVTAAGSGMGRASAELFAAEGATVIVTDIDGDAAEATAAAIIDAGGSARARQLDVGDVDALRSVFAEIERDFEMLHVLFNHAGTPGPYGFDATEEEVDRFLAINAKSVYFATSLAIPLLTKAAPHASIIYTSSSRAVIASPKRPMYSFAKAGVVTFAQAVAKQLGPVGIRANSILPGFTRTAMTAEFMGSSDPAVVEAGAAAVVAGVPLGREGLPEDVAPVALFLACDDSRYVTGVAIPVDGGYLA